MKRIFLGLFVIFFSLQARENPFFPSKGEQDLPYTSNQIKEVSPLKSASIKLPSTARIIKKVTVTYENLDASLESKDAELNHSIDWHLPIFISQSYIQELREDPEKKKELIEIEKKKSVYKKIAAVAHAKFFISGKNLKIVTTDPAIRNFLLGQPHRIVIDFKKESSLKSYVQTIEDSVFTKIRVGNHDGYYRVVVELDGYYRYTLKKQADGCLITLR